MWRSSDADELCELGCFLESAARLKHVVGHVKDFVLHPAVWIMKCFHLPPGALDCVRTSASTHINETDLVIHRFVCRRAFLCPVSWPAVTDNCPAGFVPVMKNSHQRVGGSLWNG